MLGLPLDEEPGRQEQKQQRSAPKNSLRKFPKKAILGRPGHFMLCVTLLREDMPHGDQQFASDGDNRLLFADPLAQALKLSFPMRMMFHRHPGGFHYHAPQIASALFGNMSALMGFTRVMHACSKPSIADQLLGRRKARDIADGGQDAHDGEHPETRKLHQKGHLLDPGFARRESSQLCLNRSYQVLQGM